MNSIKSNTPDEDVVIEKTAEKFLWIRNISVSVLLHILFFVMIFFVSDIDRRQSKINPNSLFFEIENYQPTNKTTSEIKDNSNQEAFNKPSSSEQTSTPVTNFLTFSDIQADTTDLDQIYYESSFNLSIKYPKGWVFIDQKRKNKLDGITFWAVETNINPPPYIHLEVLEKYLFNEKRYKYKLELKDFMAFYNDPEEIAGQVTQSFYIRTDEENDFGIKLIINGIDSFNAFQPKFLAILKSFEFGNDIF